VAPPAAAPNGFAGELYVSQKAPFGLRLIYLVRRKNIMSFLKFSISTIISIFAAAANADITQGLVGYYPFDSDANDKSQYENNGIPMGSIQYVAGKYGNAILLNGIDSYVRIPNSSQINFETTHDFAISAWIKADTNQPDLGNIDNDIIEKWYSGESRYPFVVRFLNKTNPNSGHFEVAQYDGVIVDVAAIHLLSKTTLDDGDFHHLIFQRKNGIFGLYIDGKLQQSKEDATPNDTTNTSDLFIGCRGNFNNGCGQNKFKGAVDELRIYDRGLSTPEITTLAGITPNISGSIKGYNPRTVSISCENKTTGQSVVIKTALFDCANSGLSINSGDIVNMKITGKAK